MNELLDQAGRIIERIDALYEEADINGKLDLKPARDAAYSEYHRARSLNIGAARQLTASDRSEMAGIHAAFESAATTQAAIGGAMQLAKLLKTVV